MPRETLFSTYDIWIVWFPLKSSRLISFFFYALVTGLYWLEAHVDAKTLVQLITSGLMRHCKEEVSRYFRAKISSPWVSFCPVRSEIWFSADIRISSPGPHTWKSVVSTQLRKIFANLKKDQREIWRLLHSNVDLATHPITASFRFFSWFRPARHSEPNKGLQMCVCVTSYAFWVREPLIL